MEVYKSGFLPEHPVLASYHGPMNWIMNKVEVYNKDNCYGTSRAICLFAGSFFASLAVGYQAAAVLLKSPLILLNYTIFLIPIRIDGEWRRLGNYLLPKGFDISETAKHAIKIAILAVDIVACPILGLISPEAAVGVHLILGLANLEEDLLSESDAKNNLNFSSISSDDENSFESNENNLDFSEEQEWGFFEGQPIEETPISREIVHLSRNDSERKQGNFQSLPFRASFSYEERRDSSPGYIAENGDLYDYNPDINPFASLIARAPEPKIVLPLSPSKDPCSAAHLGDSNPVSQLHRPAFRGFESEEKNEDQKFAESSCVADLNASVGKKEFNSPPPMSNWNEFTKRRSPQKKQQKTLQGNDSDNCIRHQKPSSLFDDIAAALARRKEKQKDLPLPSEKDPSGDARLQGSDPKELENQGKKENRNVPEPPDMINWDIFLQSKKPVVPSLRISSEFADTKTSRSFLDDDDLETLRMRQERLSLFDELQQKVFLNKTDGYLKPIPEKAAPLIEKNPGLLQQIKIGFPLKPVVLNSHKPKEKPCFLTTTLSARFAAMNPDLKPSATSSGHASESEGWSDDESFAG